MKLKNSMQIICIRLEYFKPYNYVQANNYWQIKVQFLKKYHAILKYSYDDNKIFTNESNSGIK